VVARVATREEDRLWPLRDCLREPVGRALRADPCVALRAVIASARTGHPDVDDCGAQKPAPRRRAARARTTQPLPQRGIEALDLVHGAREGPLEIRDRAGERHARAELRQLGLASEALAEGLGQSVREGRSRVEEAPRLLGRVSLASRGSLVAFRPLRGQRTVPLGRARDRQLVRQA